MAAAPEWKVYDSHNTYQAACKDIAAAAALMGFYGPRSTIRHDHRTIVWTEGADGNACDSYDETARIVEERVQERLRKAFGPGAL